MFGVGITLALYAVQLVSLAEWIRGAVSLLGQQKKFQHAEWHAQAARLFMGYCILEFCRIIDGSYPDFEHGYVYSPWGVVPFGFKAYAWVLRDILMFRGICVYMEHALVWTHSCLGKPVPSSILTITKVGCYFGNVELAIAATIYLCKNNEFWQPVMAMGQIPPNVAVAIACYYLYGILQKVPDCEESRHAIIVNLALLVAAFSCTCVFIPWAVPKMLSLYSKPSSVHPGVPTGSSIMFETNPSFLGTGERQLDLSLELVELTVGWCGYFGLKLVMKTQCPAPGENLVLSSQEVGQIVAKSAGKKNL
jgi:hypothetical protein